VGNKEKVKQMPLLIIACLSRAGQGKSKADASSGIAFEKSVAVGDCWEIQPWYIPCASVMESPTLVYNLGHYEIIDCICIYHGDVRASLEINFKFQKSEWILNSFK
jgi:hypothetical protein